MESIEITDWSMESYRRFLAAKRAPIHRVEGNTIYMDRFNYTDNAHSVELAPHLFDYQRFIIKLALQRRRLAVFSWIGTGKTAMFLEWVRHVSKRIYPKKTLIISQLHLIQQTLDEHAKFYGFTDIVDINSAFGGDIEAFMESSETTGIVNVDKFNNAYRLQDHIGAIVLDESSVLKNETAKRRTNIINSCKGIPWKMACSATPAPNDRQEYANHALFLGYIDNWKQFFTKFFYNTGSGNDFIMKPHARRAFYEFLATWSVFLRTPKAYGFQDYAFELEEPEVIWERIGLTDQQRMAAYEHGSKGQLNMFSGNAGGITNRSKISQISKGFLYGDNPSH